MKATCVHIFESRPGPGPSSLSLSQSKGRAEAGRLHRAGTRTTTRGSFGFGLARGRRSFGERKVDTAYKDTRRQSLLALESPENVGPVEESVAAFAQSVSVSVESLQTSRNLRELTASTYIDAPIESVWDTLTSYETLNEFIPGLAVNECLERSETGATLLQIGVANTAVGFRFKAKVLLKIQEYYRGVPEDHIFGLHEDRAEENLRDITFSQLEGDFKEYEGVWRMIGVGGRTKLVYILRVKPQPWLPVSLVMMQVSQEVKTNLASVRKQAEK